MINKEMKEHVLEAIKKDVRYDGRKKNELRQIKIEKDIAESAEGSCKVTIGDTEVIAGVKLSIETPYPDTPEEGMLMVNAEFMPMASPEFETGPPSIESIELSRVVDRGIRESGAIDVKKLCIKKGEKVWSVGIDIITINDDGNLMDAAGIAALAALKNTVFPKVDKDGAVDYKEKTKKGLPLDKEPIMVTVHLIGDEIIVDPIASEETVSDARLSVASIDENTLCAMQKGGTKSLTAKQVSDMIDLAIEKSKEIRKIL